MQLKDIVLGEYGLEGKVYFSLFNTHIRFLAKNDVPVNYVEKCADSLNSFSNEVINDLCKASIKYCEDFLNSVDEEPMIFRKTRDVLSAIRPVILVVPRPENGEEPVVHLELNCDWEVEHGMEWIVRKNKVLYVGAFEGYDPWRDFSLKDSWNYA